LVWSPTLRLDNTHTHTDIYIYTYTQARIREITLIAIIIGNRYIIMIYITINKDLRDSIVNIRNQLPNESI